MKYFYVVDGTTGNYPPSNLFDDFDACKESARAMVLQLRTLAPGSEGFPRWVKFYRFTDQDIAENGAFSGDQILSWWREQELQARLVANSKLVLEALELLQGKKRPNKKEKEFITKVEKVVKG